IQTINRRSKSQVQSCLHARRLPRRIHSQNAATQTWDTWTVPVLGGSSSRLMQNAAGLSWFAPDRIAFSQIMAGTAVHMGVVTARENRAEEREIYFPSHERAMAHYSYPSPDHRSLLLVE